jgi:hypothetical protein
MFWQSAVQQANSNNRICTRNARRQTNFVSHSILLTLLVSAWSATRVLLGVSMEKVTGVGFLAGAMAEVLAMFALGILVCAALYAFAIFFEAALVRRKMRVVSPK